MEAWSHALFFGLFFKKIYEQSLDTNLIIANNYNFTKNIFIEYEFWQIHN